MFDYKTSFGHVHVEYDQNHFDQVVPVGYWLDGKELDMDDEAELIMDIEKELHQQAMDEWNKQYI
jgi:hypothetical protein